jgi:hypothetical protein
LFVLLPQRCLSPVLVLVGELCMDIVALFIKRGESLFRGETSRDSSSKSHRFLKSTVIVAVLQVILSG